MSRPAFTHDLLASERAFVAAMTSLGFGRFEHLRIDRGEIVLDPWPTAVRETKFGCQDPGGAGAAKTDFQLKPQVAEFFEYVRAVDAGEICCLVVRHGLPFTMEVEHRVERRGGHDRA